MEKFENGAEMRLEMFVFTDTTYRFSEGVDELCRAYAKNIADHDVTLVFNEGSDSLKVCYDCRSLTIDGMLPIHFFRGLSTFLMKTSEADKPFTVTEEIHFDSLGAMLDCSRNAVLSVSMVKEYLRFLSAAGMNLLMLYTEDTYEVEDYPYFGAYRGRYTHKELKEIDDYAFALGIEVVPCIQTLAHLRCALRWPAMDELSDTNDILYVSSPKVAKFLESIITAASAPFRSRRIHLGMDEAHYLGLGRYLLENGYKSRLELMTMHLEQVQSICDKLGLESMVWSDMFFRVHSPSDEYYSIPEGLDLAGYKLPSEHLHLAFWDYYHSDTNIYERFLKLHKQMDSGCYFAGGGWVWNGLAPNMKKAFVTTDAGISACKRINLRNAFCTMWQDNGAETPHMAGYPAILYFAEGGYADAVNKELLSQKLKFLTGIDLESYTLMSRLDNHPSVTDENLTANPSKYCLYQDVLGGLFDLQIKNFSLGEYYNGLALEFDNIDNQNLLVKYYRRLAHALAKKADLGNRIYDAYHSGDKALLREIASTDIPGCIEEISALHKLREELWFRENKAFGYEVLDIRFGGVKARLSSAARRLLMFADNKIDSIEELEEPRLKYLPGSDALVGCNFWEKIVSACVVAGV